ncbi:MAG: hypothetical protein AAF723_01155 [Pseudomonadota bacterium]
MANQIVAFQDERHGLGAWVAEQIAADLFRYGVVIHKESGEVLLNEDKKPITHAPPHHRRAVGNSYGMSLNAPGSETNVGGNVIDAPRAQGDSDLDFAYRTWTSPRSTPEATFSAVISGQAQVGVVPLYDHDNSFDKATLAALMDFPQNQVLREYVAESNYVLAAPTDLIHEIEQSGFTDSYASSGSAAPFTWNREKQQRFLRKVTKIYASADAMKHCAAALDGFRAQGVDVQLLPDGVDSSREGLRLATDLLDPNRQVETHFADNKHMRVSKSSGANHKKPVVAVLLSADKAMDPKGYSYDSDYAILEAEMAGADRIRTSFIALTKGQDRKPSSHRPMSEWEAVEAQFQPPRKNHRGKVDHRALYPIATDKAWDKTAKWEAPAYARFLYSFDTVGDGAKDISPVFRVLAEQKLSYQTTNLDNRPGHPMVVAVDVPAGNYSAMKPVVKTISQMSNMQRLAAFPALQPMVKSSIRPRATGTTARGKTALALIGAILVAVAAFVYWHA